MRYKYEQMNSEYATNVRVRGYQCNLTSCVLFTTKKKKHKNNKMKKNSESSTLYRFYTINNNDKKAPFSTRL